MDPGMLGETIVAVATPEGEGGLAVVRLSGPAALIIARRVVAAGALDDPVTSHRARLAVVRWPADVEATPPYRGAVQPGQELDQALVLPLLAPGSYTGEDTVEFFCHGGLLPARLIAAACRAAGARPAGAGEFTRRAFLNGRLSLAEAEAVADLIQAEHAAGARAALAQLRGGFERELAAVAGPLRTLLIEIEGAMEFADEEVSGPTDAEIATIVGETIARLDGLTSLATASRRLREGVHVVLAGPPNAGKSSLFNALLGEDRVIVDPQAGTTRDIVSARVVHGGLLYVLHDTAGLWSGGGRVEKLSVERTERALATADIILQLHPATGEAFPLPSCGEEAAVLVVATKSDLGRVPAADIATSSVTGEGIDELWTRIAAIAQTEAVRAAAARGVFLNDRHRERLQCCRDQLREFTAASASGPVTLDVAAMALRSALLELDEISGRVFSERLLGEIFARFCVGK